MTRTMSKEKLIERGKMPWGNTQPPVYLCAQCLTAEINAGVGLCRNCLQMVEAREAEPQFNDHLLPGKAMIVAAMMMIAFIVFVIAGGLGR